jgi:type I restriction enzyme R subunit
MATPARSLAFLHPLTLSAAQEGRPTFSYTIREGINEHFLADYRIYAAETVLTFEGTEWEEEEIGFGDWGRTAESEDRLKLIIDEYFRVEEERPQPHPRKTIVFAVSEKQAVILERLFNQLQPTWKVARCHGFGRWI